MRVREFIIHATHAMKERVGRSGIVLLAAAGPVLASVGIVAAGDREDCAATAIPTRASPLALA